MDFTLTDERRMLQETLQRYIADHAGHDARRATLDSGAPYDEPLFAGLAELGVIGALFPEDRGGFGGTGADIALIFEELGRAGTLEPFLPAVLAAPLIGGERAEAVIGGTVVALAHSEPQARYHLDDVTSHAKTRDGAITLNGMKTGVLFGGAAQHFIVSARESGGRFDEDGISLFLVPADAQGVTVTALRNVDGAASAQVAFEAVNVDDAARIGAAGAGFGLLEAAVAHGTLALCAEALGAMEAAKALTVDYQRERQQFGRPIGSFQALQHRMADMLTEIEQARSAVVNLAGHLDQPRALRERHVSATKNLIGRVGALVAEECIQLHGGIGMTEEYALSHHARRLVMIDHQFGDTDHHLERFIALSTG